jgi:hypothetical protein
VTKLILLLSIIVLILTMLSLGSTTLYFTPFVSFFSVIHAVYFLRRPAHARPAFFGYPPGWPTVALPSLLFAQLFSISSIFPLGGGTSKRGLRGIVTVGTLIAETVVISMTAFLCWAQLYLLMKRNHTRTLDNIQWMDGGNAATGT